MFKKNLFQKLSHHTLQVSGRCQLRCGHCDLWKTPEKEGIKVDKTVAKLIKNGTFFNHHPRVGNYHIIGGESTLNPVLIKILTFLKNEGIRCRLWTNGIITIDQIESIRSLVDQIDVYLPGYSCQIYRDITGEDAFDGLVDNLRYMTEKQIPFACHFPIRLDNIETLPEVYELAYQEQFPLLFHYALSDGYTGDSVAFIERYRNVDGVSVYRHDKWPELGCPVLPLPSVFNWRQVLRRYYDDGLKGIMRVLRRNLDHRV